jgi:hypothetical protein
MATFTYTLSNAENVSVDQLTLDVKSEFQAFKARHEADEVAIANAVGAVFDENRGAGLNFDYIRSQVNAKLGVGNAAFKEVSDRIHAYLKANTAVKETNLTPSGAQPLFVNAKGRKDGGTRRISDIAVPAVPAV